MDDQQIRQKAVLGAMPEHRAFVGNTVGGLWGAGYEGWGAGRPVTAQEGTSPVNRDMSTVLQASIGCREVDWRPALAEFRSFGLAAWLFEKGRTRLKWLGGRM